MHQPGVGATTKDTRVLALRDQSHTLASWWQQRRAPVMTDPATSLSVTMACDWHLRLGSRDGRTCAQAGVRSPALR
jgi:hypothetical protein